MMETHALVKYHPDVERLKTSNVFASPFGSRIPIGPGCEKAKRSRSSVVTEVTCVFCWSYRVSEG